jgi:hypothetical protein
VLSQNFAGYLSGGYRRFRAVRCVRNIAILQRNRKKMLILLKNRTKILLTVSRIGFDPHRHGQEGRIKTIDCREII